MFEALSKPHWKTNLDARIQFDENHAGTISGGDGNGTTLDGFVALHSGGYKTGLANRLHV